MDHLQLGLRFAASALFFVMLVNLTRDPESAKPAATLRRWAWGCMSSAIVFGYSPVNVARALGHASRWEDAILLGAVFLTVCAAMLWSAARGFSQGGTRRTVMAGAGMNLVLVSLCLIVAAQIR